MSRAGDWVGPGGLLHYAIAPLDIAIWDAFGKTLGQPVSRMLGGARDRLPVYASDGFWYSLSLDELAASARRAFDAGFRAVKLRVGNEKHPDGEVARVRAVREAVGPSVSIMTDATETWSVDRAIRTGKAVAGSRRRLDRGSGLPHRCRGHGAGDGGAGGDGGDGRASVSDRRFHSLA